MINSVGYAVIDVSTRYYRSKEQETPNSICLQARSREGREREVFPQRTDDRDFPGGAVVKNPPANAGDMGSNPGPGRSHMLQSN